MKKERLGEVLTERGKISAADLTSALQQHSLARRTPRNRFGGAWHLVLRAGMRLPERVDRA